MKEDIKVSICCVTYNHERYIDDALNSFLSQVTTLSFEIVISDDASKDNTNNIIQRYKDRYPDKIRYFSHSKNKGMMGNYIFALSQCKGEYIAICEGDDYWVDPYKLRKQVDFLNSNKDYVLSYHNVITQNMPTTNKTKEDAKKILFKKSPENIPVGHRYHTSSMMFRNIIDNYPPQIYEVENTGDSFLQFIISRYGSVFFQRNIYPNIRRRNKNSLYSFLDKKEKLENSILLKEKILEIATSDEKENLQKALIKSYVRLINYYQKKGALSMARHQFFKIFRKSVKMSLKHIGYLIIYYVYTNLNLQNLNDIKNGYKR